MGGATFVAAVKLTVAGEARVLWVAGWGPALSMMYAPGLLLITCPPAMFMLMPPLPPPPLLVMP